MFVRIVHHWAKPGQAEVGRKFMDGTGGEMEKASGFLYRYRMEPTDGSEFITSLSAWLDEESYRNFQSGRAPYSTNPHYPFERTESQEFTVQASHGK